MYLKDELPVLERWICSGCGSLPCEKCRHISKTNQAIFSIFDDMTAMRPPVSSDRFAPIFRSRGVLGKCHFRSRGMSKKWRHAMFPCAMSIGVMGRKNLALTDSLRVAVPTPRGKNGGWVRLHVGYWLIEDQGVYQPEKIRHKLIKNIKQTAVINILKTCISWTWRFAC